MAVSKRQIAKHAEILKPLGILTGLFIVSRILLFAAGLRYETWGSRLIMHFVHPSLLSSNLFESIFYLHSQPPLFNLFIGIIVKLFSESRVMVLHACYLACGLILTWSLYFLMVRLGVRSRLAIILTALFMLNPATILFENLLLYTYPVVTMLCVSAVVLNRYMDRGRLRDGLLFFLLLMVITLTRSLYHLIWIAAAMGLLMLLRQKIWKTTLTAAIIPLLLVFSLYAKNYMLFGTFSSSTWMGMSFCKLTTDMLPEGKRFELISEGKVSELTVVPSYRGLWYYRDRVNLPAFEKTGIPVLDLERYTEGGLNYNNLSYISLSAQYMKDGLYVLAHFPKTYVKGLLNSFKIFFFPSSDWFAMLDETNKNRKILKPVITPFNMIIQGQLFNRDDPTFSPDYTWTQYAQPAKKVGLFLVVWVIIAIASGAGYTASELRKKKPDMARAGTMLFMLMTILYVTVIGNCLEVGENHRFRYNIDPFLLVFLGLFIQDMLNRFKKPAPQAVEAGRRKKSRNKQ